MSDVQCPICQSVSCNKTVSNENELIHVDNKDYIMKENGLCRWKDNFQNEYTSAFNSDTIQTVNSVLAETLTNMASTTQDIIDNLFILCEI